jgi:F-type H+-transporting ATPase subunit b
VTGFVQRGRAAYRRTARRAHAGLYSTAPGIVLFAQADHGGGGAAEEESGNFLVTPSVGLMIWTLIAFGITMLILKRLAFPRIGEALDKRAQTIRESVEAAEHQRKEADELLAEYRKRLMEAREQADDIIARARKAAETVRSEAAEQGQARREELVAAARRDIEAETRHSLERIRKEVADLTVMATEKVTRKSLDPEDHRRLIQEALEETDFSALVPEGNGNATGGGEVRS